MNYYEAMEDIKAEFERRDLLVKLLTKKNTYREFFNNQKRRRNGKCERNN